MDKLDAPTKHLKGSSNWLKMLLSSRFKKRGA